MNSLPDIFMFIVLPYLAFAIFVVESIRRYSKEKHSFTSRSSQFLENRFHFWGMVPFHYGLLITLLGHGIAFALPRELLWWNSIPARLFILEVTALIFGLMALVGIIHIMIRRMKHGTLRVVTSRMDWVLYGFLFLIIASGVSTAILYRYGTSWFASAISPYLWSLVKLQPDISAISQMPHLFKLHVVSAFCLLAVFPFTKLVHVLVVPNHYFFRKKQVVKWNWNRKAIRHEVETPAKREKLGGYG